MILNNYKVKNYVKIVQGVNKDCCFRCLSKNIYQDNYGVYHCLDCYKYGEINSRKFIYLSERTIKKKIHIYNMKFHLTKAQKKAEIFLLECYQNKKDCFLQAVCGAGKTEMTYKVIKTCLDSGGKVCFVLPRVEVIKELAKRIETVFKKTIIKTLYEGHKDYESSPLLFSTPQQLINFYHEFDLIIVDEVDAFPYKGNNFLRRLVNKALKETGVKILMSATISTEYLNLIEVGKLEYYNIPSRYHYQDLIIPVFKKIHNEVHQYKKLEIELRNNITQNKQCLIFVPSINAGLKLKTKMIKNQFKCDFISSKTIDKKQIIKSFRKKDYLNLITTTILERGVTFNNINCYVLNADNLVFTKETIIQISGRVGRLNNDINSKIILYSRYLSKQMILAKKEIVDMNKRKEFEM